jgi:membrane associated rhomboid family serine protease
VIISVSPSVPVPPPPPPPPPEAEEHYVPAPPPPLPKLDSLDSLAKGAWLALFGGPGYLLLSTALGWSIPGVAVFCAVAAFVAGVALLVFRLTDSDRDDDDGAVI